MTNGKLQLEPLIKMDPTIQAQMAAYADNTFLDLGRGWKLQSEMKYETLADGFRRLRGETPSTWTVHIMDGPQKGRTINTRLTNPGSTFMFANADVTDTYRIDKIGRGYYQHSTPNEIKFSNNETNTQEKQMPEETKEKGPSVPKIVTSYRLNSMAQTFSAKQVVEHVTKLLSSGVARINVERIIRDDANDITIQDGRYL